MMDNGVSDKTSEGRASSAARELLDRAIQAMDASMKTAKRGKAALNRAKAGFSQRPIEAIAKLVAGWQTCSGPGLAQADGCIDSLRETLKQLRSERLDRFQVDLSQACKDAGKPLRRLAAGFAIGPFSLAIDDQRLSAALVYAKVPVVKDLPLDGTLVLEAASGHEEQILAGVPQETELAKQFEEAIKVAAIRQEGRLPEGTIRVDLPSVYDEMALIRLGLKRASSGKAGSGYPVARFVVELVSLVRSGLNERSQRFRLETAVLENTRNAKKAIFIPNDLTVGHGEGTYHQAIILMNWR